MPNKQFLHKIHQMADFENPVFAIDPLIIYITITKHLC